MLKHFEQGDQKPQFDPKKLLVYVFQFCPFSRRVELTLSHHAIEHERVYINVKNKPDWFVNINPTGQVPMIEQEGQKLLDSEIICRYLDQLIDCDSLIHSRTEVSIKWVNDWWSKIFNSFQAIAFDISFTVEQEKTYLDSLRDFENLQGSGFMSGDQVSLADFLVYPVMEMTNICLARIKHPPIINNSKFPRTNIWFHHMNSVPAVQKERITDEVYRDFIKSFLKIPLDN